MNFAKTVFALLASVLLVGTQSVVAMGEKSPPQSQVCGCCACKKMDCCVAQQPTSTPQSVPVAPSRAESQNQLQIIATVVSLLLQSDKSPVQKISLAPSASLEMTSVPLYQWNCSYLI